MKAILRYTEDIQKLLGCKTKPEPWLHIVILVKPPITSGYMIYVWDTRQVLESKSFMPNEGINAKLTEAAQIGHKANDNREPLKGAGEYAIHFLKLAGLADVKRQSSTERRDTACKQAWEEYVDARDEFRRNMEAKHPKLAEQQYNAMKNAVHKLAKLGVKYDIPEWSRYEGNRYFTEYEKVKRPACL